MRWRAGMGRGSRAGERWVDQNGEEGVPEGKAGRGSGRGACLEN